MSRGMEATIYAALNERLKITDIYALLEDFYRESPFVRVREEGEFPNTLHVRGSNYCDIGFRLDPKNNRLILMAVIDNLVKGAAGQAVQNMNLMLGFPETAGLAHLPLSI
jgi:N-acetyl-gamma-glutamyl-phosphate reductase